MLNNAWHNFSWRVKGVMSLLFLHAGNKFLQDYKPWECIKSDKELCGSYLAACLGLVALLAALVEPYMPSVTRKVNPVLLPNPQCALGVGDCGRGAKLNSDSTVRLVRSRWRAGHMMFIHAL